MVVVVLSGSQPTLELVLLAWQQRRLPVPPSAWRWSPSPALPLPQESTVLLLLQQVGVRAGAVVGANPLRWAASNLSQRHSAKVAEEGVVVMRHAWIHQ